MDEPFHSLEWEEPGTQTTGAPDKIRRLTDRVGSVLPGHPDGRSLVPSRKEDAHQLPRAPGSNPGSKDLPKGPGRQKGAAVTGQSDSSSLHKQPGWDSVPPGNQVSQGLMDVVSGERHPPYSTTPTGGREYQGRQGVESDERSLRLDAEPRDFSSDMDSLSPTGSRPICHSSILPAPSLLQLASSPIGKATDAFLQDWSLVKGYANPPWNLIGRVLAKVEQQKAGLILVAPIWPSQPWYPRLLSLLVAHPLRIDPQGRVMAEDLDLVPPLAVWPISGNTTQVNDFQMRLQTSFYCHGTKKTSQLYDSLCRRWISWCTARQADPVSGPIEDVVNFLAQLYHEGYQYRSLGSYRSAIASIHAPVDGASVGQHPLVSKLMKRAFHSRPQLPRYTNTWDVNTVLLELGKHTLGQDMSLRQLSLRTVMLLSLTRPSRSVDLAKLNLVGLRNTPEGAVFLPTALAKQSRPGKEFKEFLFPKFAENEKLCPVQSLSLYMERTKALRGDATQLFISFIKPHNPVTSSTIARWLKLGMESAGIDTSIFKAHSVRSASTSAASMQGVTTEDILGAADWSTESSFQRFYYKPVHNTTFAKSVLTATNNTIDM